LSENGIPHEGLGEYLLGGLEAGERERFEAHLAGCPSCAAAVDDLVGTSALLARAVPSYDVPAGLEGRTFAAIERAAAPAPRRPRGPRRLVLAFATAAALAAGLLGGSLLVGRDGGGTLELSAVLAPRAGGPERARVDVTKTGIGRVIVLRTDDLPILPKGDYYELWFVGPGDSPAHPNRISAGTFHPDPEGRSNVRFTAAVDPSLYPVVSVTAEPGDGNPDRTGPEVLRSLP
jgi:anti-sigma-K factor RskA